MRHVREGIPMRRRNRAMTGLPMKSALCLLWLSAAGLVWADEPTFLCRQDEVLIFEYAIGGRYASVCASKDIGTGTVQYRYGRPGHIEFAYPARPEPPGGRFFLASTPYSGGGAAYISFTNAGHRYLLYDITTRTNFTPGEPNDPEFTAGVITHHNGKTTSSRACRNDASIRSAAYDSFERVAFEHELF